MNSVKLSVICILVLLSTACSMQQVKSNSTAFYVNDFTPSGDLVVTAASPEKSSSLEFMNYKKKFEEKLSSAGYNIVNSIDQADYIAEIDYKITPGETLISSSPVYATGSYRFGRSFSLGANRAVSSSTDAITLYDKLITLEIMKATTETTSENSKLYESRIKSLGSCADLAGVFDPLLTTLFNNFPGENGKTMTTTVTYQGECDD